MRSRTHYLYFSRILTRRGFSTSKDSIINEFWEKLYKNLVTKIPYTKEEERYHTHVFRKLKDFKKHQISEKWNDDDLRELQKDIEDITTTFDEKTIVFFI